MNERREILSSSSFSSPLSFESTLFGLYTIYLKPHLKKRKVYAPVKQSSGDVSGIVLPFDQIAGLSRGENALTH